MSGIVQTPDGQVAFVPQRGFEDHLYAFIFSPAQAAISGTSIVPDGTQVELVRIDDTGTILQTLATTVTSGGEYSFDLASLGLEFSCDLLVRVEGLDGVEMRAFVTNGSVNIDPVSEAVVRTVLEQIALNPGCTLSDFTLQELYDLVACSDLLTSVEQTAAGVDIETTVTAVTEAMKANEDLMTFVVATAEPGQTTVGPGDIGNFFPFELGLNWTYQVTGSDGSYQNTMVITGTKVIGTVTATVFTDSNPDNTGVPEEEYLVKDSAGITNWGNNDPDDTITPQVVPYQEGRFPLVVGGSFTQVSKSGMDMGEDLDGDATNETANLLSVVKMVGFEDVSVPAGTFGGCARILSTMTLSGALSSNPNIQFSAVANVTTWFAPSVGPVKQVYVMDIQVDGTSSHEEGLSELLDWNTPPGVGSTFPIADTASGEVSLSASFDGTNFLVAIGTEEQSGGPMSSSSQFIDLNGSLVGPLISSECNDGVPLGSAFDGTNHLLVGGDCDTWNHEIWGRLVSPSGTFGSNFLIAGTGAEKTGIAFGGGKYLFVYTRLVVADYKVYGTLIDPSGTVGSEITISTGYGSAGGFNVAFDGSRFLVVWPDDTNRFEVKGRFVGTAGSLSTEFTINASEALSQDPLTVAFDGTHYLVVWSDDPGAGDDDLYGQLVDTEGNLVGGVIPISTATGEQFLPTIAFDGANYLVTWTDFRNDVNHNDLCEAGEEGTCTDVYGQYVSTAGVLVGTEFVINDDPGDQLGVVAGFSGWKYLVLINDGAVLSEPLTWGDVYGVFVTP